MPNAPIAQILTSHTQRTIRVRVGGIHCHPRFAALRRRATRISSRDKALAKAIGRRGSIGAGFCGECRVRAKSVTEFTRTHGGHSPELLRVRVIPGLPQCQEAAHQISAKETAPIGLGSRSEASCLINKVLRAISWLRLTAIGVTIPLSAEEEDLGAVVFEHAATFARAATGRTLTGHFRMWLEERATELILRSDPIILV